MPKSNGRHSWLRARLVLRAGASIVFVALLSSIALADYENEARLSLQIQELRQEQIRTDGAHRPLVVLVPGFFNSLVPSTAHDGGLKPYFSAAIVEGLEKDGYRVFIVDTLKPVGGVTENGDRLEVFLSVLAERFRGREMNLIGHSAGGLYTLRALTKSPRLPVARVATIATPYTGAEFVDRIGRALPILETIADFFDLDSLREFRANQMAKLLSGMRIPSGVRWVATAGVQEPCFALNCAQAKRLSWVMSLTQSLMKHDSDGVVTRNSALADGVGLPIERWRDFNFALEHWEMIGESEIFHLLGVVDVEVIRKRQVRYFREIMARLQMPAKARTPMAKAPLQELNSFARPGESALPGL